MPTARNSSASDFVVPQDSLQVSIRWFVTLPVSFSAVEQIRISRVDKSLRVTVPSFRVTEKGDLFFCTDTRNLT